MRRSRPRSSGTRSRRGSTPHASPCARSRGCEGATHGATSGGSGSRCQSPRSMARVRIGTSGWVYQHWQGRFYPQKMPAAKWFEFYVQHFDTVELNNSFYRQPSRKTFEGWRARSLQDFRFAVKLNRFVTHYSDGELQALSDRIRAWRDQDLNVFANFSNDANAYAVFNALRLRELVA